MDGCGKSTFPHSFQFRDILSVREVALPPTIIELMVYRSREGKPKFFRIIVSCKTVGIRMT